MAILDRVKLRIETDLTDAELQAMIDEVQSVIDEKYGVVGAITVFLDGDRNLEGDRRFLNLIRPRDSAQAIVITEIDVGNDETILAADDFRILHGGRTLERLNDGMNGRDFWERLVKIAYTPVSDVKQRDEVIVKLVHLDITYRGLNKQVKAGDFQSGGGVTFDAFMKERDVLIDSLSPNRGVLMA